MRGLEVGGFAWSYERYPINLYLRASLRRQTWRFKGYRMSKPKTLMIESILISRCEVI